jgi:hypothetical protein
MKKNVGLADKLIRYFIAIIFVTMYFGGYVTGTLGIVFLVLGVVFAVTALLGWCALYAAVGLSTCSKDECK